MTPHINVLPFIAPANSSRSTTPAGRAGSVPTPAPATSFADVIDLAERRQRAASQIPDHVWDEVEAASRLWQELQGERRSVQFEEPHELDGRVVVSLCDLDGRRLRDISLFDAVDIGPEPEDAA